MDVAKDVWKAMVFDIYRIIVSYLDNIQGNGGKASSGVILRDGRCTNNEYTFFLYSNLLRELSGLKSNYELYKKQLINEEKKAKKVKKKKTSTIVLNHKYPRTPCILDKYILRMHPS